MAPSKAGKRNGQVKLARQKRATGCDGCGGGLLNSTSFKSLFLSTIEKVMEKNSEEIAVIPKGDIWLNWPCLGDQVTNMQIINTGNRPLAWQLSSNHEERYQFMPSRGSLLGNSSVKVCITVKAFSLEAEYLELIDDEIIVQWVEDREQRAKFNPKLFDQAKAKWKSVRVRYNA
ncbi:hypothetical protein T08_13269 [Trichinella sp. T8]|nr:hypothetical protein T08_13269 [Trichinella sp. T8]